MRKVALLCTLFPVLFACGNRPAAFTGDFDSGVVCAEKEKLIRGECRAFCARNGDCPEGQACDILTGTCGAPDVGQTDSGTVVLAPCIPGGIRCSPDKGAVETCQQDGTWVSTSTCGAGLCQNERCLACNPSATSCDTADRSYVNVCSADGLDAGRITCAAGAQCLLGECRQCSPPQTRCSDAGVPQSCDRVADPTAEFQFVNIGDNFDGTCITGQCSPPNGSQPAACVAPLCSPSSAQCKTFPDGGAYLEECSAQGQPSNRLCGVNEECIGNACINECAIAEAQKSYFGCEYWTTVMDNSMDKIFKGVTGSASVPAQGTADSEFALVVVNRSASPASIDVWRTVGTGNPVRVKTNVVIEGREGPSRGLRVIKLPWQSLGDHGGNGGDFTRIRRFGYRLTSTKPVSVYQFNPLSAYKNSGKSCSGTEGEGAITCNEDENGGSCPDFLLTDPTFYCGKCKTPTTGGSKTCHYSSNTNDGSLLLPAHILGTEYVTIGSEHMVVTNRTATQHPLSTDHFPASINIVATQNNTRVQITTRAKTTAGNVWDGGALPVRQKGETFQVTLNAYDVFQLTSSYVDAGNNAPGYVGSCTASDFNGGPNACRVDNDFTGTVVTSLPTPNADGGAAFAKPVAVFSGVPCAVHPVDSAACDHIEEQIFPFATWGSSFIGARSHSVRLTSATGPFATPAQASPDYWKIVAACPVSQCPNGTTLNITPNTSPTILSTLAPMTNSGCEPGTSLTGTGTARCRLKGGSAIEFNSRGNFKLDGFEVMADGGTEPRPIALAQFFAGQTDTAGGAIEGDPSLIMIPAVEQWRSNYTVTASPDMLDDFLSLVVDATKTSQIVIDSGRVTEKVINVPGSMTRIGTTNFYVQVEEVSNGTHTVEARAPAGASELPTVGVTVYGFDFFVSYGYAGGLDLKSIVTGINPGG